MEPYRIRAHHGMCLAFFTGHGYDEGFTGHMGKIKKELEKNPKICLTMETDAICSACPHNRQSQYNRQNQYNRQSRCDSSEKVERYDKAVLTLCGLSAGTVMDYESFSTRVVKQVLQTGKRKEICGDCQWDSICSAQSFDQEQ